jgi:Zn-dependent protease with chaperone function
MHTHRSRVRTAALLVATLAASTAAAQTQVTPPKNKYSVEDDVKAGREAAQQVERQMPLLGDDEVQSYVENLGERLVAAIPSSLQHPEFHYTFKVVNQKDINAFALPGGPMFVLRGMLEAAQTEGEVAGVMAHEISHVALRHGTAQATAATKYEIGQVAGTILGAIIGGRTGAIVARGSQLGIGISFLRFGREYEKQADLLGAQIMARAGYDPVEMANMFRTIEQQSGNGGPEFLSDHPNPGNRIEYITAEAKALRVENPVRDTARFEQMQAELGKLPRAPEQQNARATSQPVGGDVEAPASEYRTYTEGQLFRVSVPGNWRELPAGNNAVWFAPEGAYGTAESGQSVFTHGVQFGIGQVNTSDIREATRALVQSLSQGNPRLQQAGNAERTRFGDRTGLALQLRNVSDATGEAEVITVRTAMLQNNVLFYSIAVAPADEFRDYAPVFQRVQQSVQVTAAH